jgi:hypothetical protein
MNKGIKTLFTFFDNFKTRNLKPIFKSEHTSLDIVGVLRPNFVFRLIYNNRQLYHHQQ